MFIFFYVRRTIPEMRDEFLKNNVLSQTSFTELHLKCKVWCVENTVQ